MSDSTARSFLEGKIILIDKEMNWTSFDVVNKLRIELRSALGIKKIKVGHTGTLDPLATGLVILCAGKATKQIESFMGLDKEYIAELTIGATTPSFDLETEIEKKSPFEHVTPGQLESVLDAFRGQLEQTPPNYSAKQVDGKRAYNMARQGETFKLKKNLVTIHELELLNFSPPKISLRVLCSKGTYIRSLANDIGEKLGTGAYLSALRRTKIGDYHVNDAEKLSDFVKKLKPL